MKLDSKKSHAFTLLELQVALVLLTIGIVTLSSLMTTQSRLYRKLRGDFKPGATLYLTPSPDPWLAKLGVPAQVSAAPLSLSTPTSVNDPPNAVTVLDTTVGLMSESITTSVQVTETP